MQIKKEYAIIGFIHFGVQIVVDVVLFQYLKILKTMIDQKLKNVIPTRFLINCYYNILKILMKHGHVFIYKHLELKFYQNLLKSQGNCSNNIVLLI